MAQCCAAGQLTSTPAGSWALPLDLSAQPGSTLTSQGTAFLGFFLYVRALLSPPLNFRPNLGLTLFGNVTFLMQDLLLFLYPQC